MVELIVKAWAIIYFLFVSFVASLTLLLVCCLYRKDALLDSSASLVPVTVYPSPVLKRRRLTPPPCERVMIYVREENEVVYTPLHLVPPSSLGLLNAVSNEV